MLQFKAACATQDIHPQMHNVRAQSCLCGSSACHAPPHWEASTRLTLAQACFVTSAVPACCTCDWSTYPGCVSQSRKHIEFAAYAFICNGLGATRQWVFFHGTAVVHDWGHIPDVVLLGHDTNKNKACAHLIIPLSHIGCISTQCMCTSM